MVYKQRTLGSGPDFFRVPQSGRWPFRYWDQWFVYGGDGNDTIVGGESWDLLYGEAGNDWLEGRGDGNYHNELDGGSGDDTMLGGRGDDYMFVDSDRDVVIEHSGGGTDSIYSHASSYTLPNHVENLYLRTGTSRGGSSGNGYNGYGNRLSNRIGGNIRNNALYGYQGNDRIDGKEGNDRIDGGRGTDTMIGGVGDDTYYVDQLSDVIIEKPGEGYDRVFANVSGYRLANNVEELTLQRAGFGYGNSGNNTLTGSSAGDRLYGSTGHDLLKGLNGSDELYGESGTDTLYGGAYDDHLDGGTGSDQLYGEAGSDYLKGFGAGSSSAQYDNLIGGRGADTFVLGESFSDYYTGSGHAFIQDFSRAEGDKILIHGDSSEYLLDKTLSSTGSSSLDTRVFRNGDLLGIIVDNTNVSLANDFETARVVVE